MLSLIWAGLFFGRSWFFLWSPVPPVFFPEFGTCSKCTKNNWYHCHYDLIILLLVSFFTPALTNVFFLDSNSPQVDKTILSIRVYFSNAVVSIVSILPLMSCSLTLFSRFLETVQSPLRIIGITVTFMYHRYTVHS